MGDEQKHAGLNSWDYMVPEKALEYLALAIKDREAHLAKVIAARENFKANVEFSAEDIAMQRKADFLGESLSDDALEAYEEALVDWRKAKDDDAAYAAIIERTEAEIARGAVYQAKTEALSPGIEFKVSDRFLSFLGLNLNTNADVPKKVRIPEDIDASYFED